MINRILLVLVIGIPSNFLFAQVEFNYKGVLGINYMIDAVGGFPIIANALPGSPAFLAGVKNNDRLLKINDVSLSGITAEALAEKFIIAMGVSIKILVEHDDKTQQEMVLKKVGYIAASYKNYKYLIFFDENKNTLSKPNDNWVYYSFDGTNGIGYYVYSPTQAFYGVFEDQLRTDGLFYYVDKGKQYYYLGEFKDDKYSGKGTNYYTTATGDDYLYTGGFLNGLQNGFGEIKNANGKLVYSGELVNGNYTGKGTLSYTASNGKGYVYTGDFLNSKANGTGKTTDATGKMVYEGGYKDWQYHGTGIQYADDGYVLCRGQWINDEYQIDYNNPKYNGLTAEQKAEEIKTSEAYRRAGVSEKLIAGMNAFLNAPSAGPSYSQTNSGSSSSALDNAAASITASQQQDGWALYESFDVSFSQYSVGSCFTSCSEKERDIYIIAEETSSLRVSDLVVSYVQRSSDISDHQHLTAPFQKHSSQNGIAVYGNSVQVVEIKSACSYHWTISSGDATKHKARILVFWGK